MAVRKAEKNRGKRNAKIPKKNEYSSRRLLGG